MIPSIKELRRICQPKEIIEKDPFYFRYVIRKLSIYITRLFLHTPISANQITILHVICGVAGGILIALDNYSLRVLGALFVQLHVLFDNVDGEVARFRKTTGSIIGPFTDRLGHSVVNSTLFIAMSFNVCRQYDGNLPILLFGFLALTYYSIIFNYQATWYLAVAESKESEADRAVTVKVLKYRDYKKAFFEKHDKFFFLKYIAKIGSYVFFSRFREVVVIVVVLDRMDILLFTYGAILPFMLITMYLLDCIKTKKIEKMKR